jgi:hypothetical protein
MYGGKVGKWGILGENKYIISRQMMYEIAIYDIHLALWNIHRGFP